MYSVEITLRNERGEVINHDIEAIYHLELAG